MPTDPLAGRDPHTTALLAAADDLGLSARDRSDEFPPDAVEFAGSGRSALVLKGRSFPWLHEVAERTLDDKAWTKRRLAELSIPTPNGRTFWAAADLKLDWASVGAQVCKPVEGTHGQGVALGLTTAADLEAHCSKHPASAWILEDLIVGEDLRLQVLEGRLVAACVRRPASVIGDGRSTVAQLMIARDAEVRALNPANRCVPDPDTDRALAGQSLDLGSTPGGGVTVTVKTVANLAVGASVLDVTDEVHPTWGTWVAKFAELVELPFFAMDAISPDPGLDPLTCGAAVLEANARPQWLHHTFSEGRTHDLPRQILKALFAPST